MVMSEATLQNMTCQLHCPNSVVSRCFAERKRRGFLWHRFIKNVVLRARIRLPCLFLLLVIKHPVGNIWDHMKRLAQMLCPIRRPCGSGGGSPGLRSPVGQLGKAVPGEGHAAEPCPWSIDDTSCL